MPVDTQSCTKIKVSKNECCYKTTTETINQNQNINLVNFPALAKVGDTHIVQFKDSLVVYEFTTEWELKINHPDVTIIEIPTIAFTNPLEPTTFELLTWIDANLTDNQKLLSYLKYNYGDARLTTLSGQVYLIKDNELTKISDSNPFRNGNILVLNIDVIGGSDTRELHEYEDGASYLTLDKAISDFSKYFDAFFVDLKIANSSPSLAAKITAVTRVYNKFISFSSFIPNTEIEVSIENWLELRHCSFSFTAAGNLNFNGAGEVFSWDSHINLISVGNNINLSNGEGRVGFRMAGGHMSIGDVAPGGIPVNIVYRANDTKLLGCLRGETGMTISQASFINPSFTDCKLVAGSASNGGGFTGSVNISLHNILLGNINSISNIYWGGHAFIKVYNYDPNNYIPACIITTGRDQLLPLDQWSTSCTGGTKKVYKALLTQEGTSAPVATVLENTLGGPIVWTRLNTGGYLGTLTGAFLVDKVFGQNFGGNVIRGLGSIGSGNMFMFVEVKRQTDNTIIINITDNLGDFIDLNNYAVIPIEIEVYP